MKKHLFYFPILLFFFFCSCSKPDISENVVAYLNELQPNTSFGLSSVVGSEIDSVYIQQPYSNEIFEKDLEMSDGLKSKLNANSLFDHICTLIFTQNKKVVKIAVIPRNTADFSEITPISFPINQLFYLDEKRNVSLYSLSNEQATINQTNSIEKIDALSLDGKVFFRVEQDSLGKYYIFEPCYAAVANYRINNDSISHNWGQETDYLYVVSNRVKNDMLFFEVSLMGRKEYRETIAFKKLDNKGIFWRINDDTFIDSIYSNRVPVVKEICDEEW